MAILVTGELEHRIVGVRRDNRDPLGVAGRRLAVVGDASGGVVQFTFRVGLEESGKYVYSILAIDGSEVPGQAGAGFEARLLTNAPPLDASGLAAFNLHVREFSVGNINGVATPDAPLIRSPMEHLLFYSPGPSVGLYDIIAMTITNNILATNYTGEVYFLYYDRLALSAPGGPRTPGKT